MKPKTIQTVNVQVVIGGGVVEETYSFPDTPEGNLDAELKFKELMNEKIWNIHEYDDEDFEESIDNGYASFGNKSIIITHST
jgi:hypothetical protein